MFHCWQPSFLWETWTCQISAGNLQGIRGVLGDCWRPWKRTSWHSWWVSLPGHPPHLQAGHQEEFLHRKGCLMLEWGAQGDGGITIPVVQETIKWGTQCRGLLDKVVFSQRLDSVIPEVCSKQFCDSENCLLVTPALQELHMPDKIPGCCFDSPPLRMRCSQLAHFLVSWWQLQREGRQSQCCKGKAMFHTLPRHSFAPWLMSSHSPRSSSLPEKRQCWDPLQSLDILKMLVQERRPRDAWIWHIPISSTAKNASKVFLLAIKAVNSYKGATCGNMA